MKLGRRTFVAGGAAGAAAMALAGCNTGAPTADAEPEAEAGPFSETLTDAGYMLVENPEGPALGYSPDSGMKIIEVDGLPFKDFEGDGELAPYADWRLPAAERAADLASRLSIEQIAGLMCFSAHQRQLDDTNVNEEQAEFLTANVRAVLNAMSGYPAYEQAEWSNSMQAFVEGSDNKIPVNFSSDPRNGRNCYDWPNNIALAASFDPALARRAGQGIASDLRKMGVTTFLGPQVDIASDPRWSRFSGTFGEDPALARDMTRGLVDGLQSTLDENGEDMGWGSASINSMVKHWPAEGAGEGGREGHLDGGKYAVYPSDNFEALMIPFVDGAFKLDGKTECAADVMTSYTIAWSEDGKYGEHVGSGFSSYKIADLLRDRYAFEGGACTDWAVLNDVDLELKNQWRCWGLEDGNEWNPAKRASLAVSVGVDQMGGCNDPTLLVSAYEDMAAEIGEAEAKANFTKVGERLLLGYFNTGLFENPYVDPDVAKKTVDLADEAIEAEALAAQVKGIVMLKNHDGVIKAGSEDAKLKAYVPMRYVAASRSASGMDIFPWGEKVASCSLPLPIGVLQKYFDVVTDTLAEELTGPMDESGDEPVPTPALEDLTRATAADIADCDFVLVCAEAPVNASPRAGRNEDLEYIPLSVQYRPYTADSDVVRKESIAGDIVDGVKENRSYYGKTSMINNEYQLDQILEAAALAKEAGKPCIVILSIQQPMCVHEFESEVDAIVVSMSGSTEAACRIVAGLDEPSGLLPMQMPKDMIAVESQLEDACRDMDCYVDADGNVYDFAFGLNYAGPIDDDRVATYKVPVLTAPEA